MTLYRGMGRREIDVAYNNRAVVPGWEGYLARWQARSATLYAAAPVRRDLRYGAGPRQRFDLFLGDRGAPTILFLHGGYWQWNDKEGQAFIAEGLLPHGFNVAIGEYTLAPQADMARICAEAAAMIRSLAVHLKNERRDPNAIWLSGISTGAHLMALGIGLPRVRGALLISGIYDLEPIRLSSLNDAIGMDAAAARRYSPLHRRHRTACPATIAFGAAERPEICRQSRDFAGLLQAQGHDATLLAVPDADHFSVLETFADKDGLLSRRLREMVAARPITV
jgi:acetyl esterase/lipase